MCGLCRMVRLIVSDAVDSAGLGRGRGSGVGWHLCSGCADGVADRLPFYVRRWTLGVASRMLVIMNGYNRTGGSNAFLMVFSHVGNGCGDGACGRRGGASCMWLGYSLR